MEEVRVPRAFVLTAALPPAIWVAAHRSTLAWMGQSFSVAKPLNLALLGAVATVLVMGIGMKSGRGGRRRLSFRLRPLPFALAVAAALADQAARRLSSFDQVSVFLFVLGTFGLLGCYVSPGSWRRSLPAALLLAVALPFGARFGTGLGYPARVLTAQWVEAVLAAAGVSSISMHDVIVLENGVAHVDLPCSGLKSLWTGSLFFLAATWIERRSLGLRWLVGFGGLQLLLFFANTTRVLLLVVTGLVFDQQRLASLLHVPLGVCGFLACCAAGVMLLRLCPAAVRPDAGKSDVGVSAEPIPSPPPVWALAALALVALTIPPLDGPALAAAMPPIALPAELEARPLSLTPAERRFFASKAGTQAAKWEFEYRSSLRGSLLLVSTPSWQTHHAPELCLAAAGLEVDAIRPANLGDGFALHRLELEAGSRSAVYWFQSLGTTTGSLLHRLWSDLVHGETRWVLVSILLDTAPNLRSPDMSSLLRSLRQRVNAGLGSALQELDHETHSSTHLDDLVAPPDVLGLERTLLQRHGFQPRP